MDLLDNILGDMKKSAPVKKPAAKKPESSTPGTSAWNRPLPGKMAPIPKRTNTDQSGPLAKRQPKTDSFNPYGTAIVQTNMFDLDISKLDQMIHKVLFQVTLYQDNGWEFEVNMGLASNSGDVNRQIRRRAQWVLFQNWFRKNHHLFIGDSTVAAYDCAETIYVGNSNFQGGLNEHLCEFTKDDFTEKDWFVVTRLSRRKLPKFKIRIKSIGTVYTSGPLALTDENRPELTRCIETITNQCLNNGDFLLYNTGVYPVDGRLSEPDEVIEIKSGFSKTPRVVETSDGQIKVILTIDTASSPFYKATGVVKFMTAKLMAESGGGGGGHRGGRGRNEQNDEQNARNLDRDFEDNRISKGMVSMLSKSLKRMDCEATHLVNTGANRTITIDSLAECNAITCTFPIKEGETERSISVKDYFLEKYQIKLRYPHLPLAVSKRMKSIDYFPVEVLRLIPGQRVQLSAMTTAIQSYMTGKNSSLPSHHVQEAQKILMNYLQLGIPHRPNAHLTAFNLVFPTTKPITVRAKILAPPMIKFGGNKSYQPDPKRGVRFQTDGKFVEPAKIKSMAIVCFDRNFEGQVRRFCEQLVSHCRAQNMVIEQPVQSWTVFNTFPEDKEGVKRYFSECIRKKVSIVFAITPEKRPEMHDTLKYYEERMGLQTIQVCSETATKMTNGQGGRQTIDNVMRKFNPKTGGTNFFIDIPQSITGTLTCTDVAGMRRKLYESTQFIGIELSHTGARPFYHKQRCLIEGDPTVVGIAYSLKNSTQLGGFSYYQNLREYTLNHVEKKFRICVDAYETAVKKLPQTIVVYRIGTGEGDHPKVRKEVDEMKASLKKKNATYAPKFVVILVQKNSHTRLFPEKIQGNRAGEQNVVSGTCVDSAVTGYGAEEFILCSQTPLIGTVRPTRYTVLVNEAGWTKNEVMNVTYQLAFGHQVSYQPPSVPDVLYAAENLAKRGHNNFKTHKHIANLAETADDIMAEHEDLKQQLAEKELEEAFMNLMIDEISNEVNQMTISGKNFWA